MSVRQRHLPAFTVKCEPEVVMFTGVDPRLHQQITHILPVPVGYHPETPAIVLPPVAHASSKNKMLSVLKNKTELTVR